MNRRIQNLNDHMKNEINLKRNSTAMNERLRHNENLHEGRDTNISTTEDKQHGDKKGNSRVKEPAHNKWTDWGKSLKIASLNCKGKLEQTKRERVALAMSKNKIDILCLQETHVKTHSKEIVDGYDLVGSSGVLGQGT